MLLRRAVATFTALGVALTLAAAPAAAHEGHEDRARGRNKEVFVVQCHGVGTLTIEVTSAGEGRGVGRIIEGGKGVLIPTIAVFEVRNETTGAVLSSEAQEFSGGQQKLDTTTCTSTVFTGTLADIELFDPEFAAELREAGVSETDVIVAEITVQVLLRGPIARSGR